MHVKRKNIVITIEFYHAFSEKKTTKVKNNFRFLSSTQPFLIIYPPYYTNDPNPTPIPILQFHTGELLQKFTQTTPFLSHPLQPNASSFPNQKKQLTFRKCPPSRRGRPCYRRDRSRKLGPARSRGQPRRRPCRRPPRHYRCRRRYPSAPLRFLPGRFRGDDGDDGGGALLRKERKKHEDENILRT